MLRTQRGRSSRSAVKMVQRMPSKTSGLEIADAVLIGERHDSPVAKQYVRGRLQRWFQEGYTRLGIEKPSDQVIPEELFEQRPVGSHRVSSGEGKKRYWGFSVGDVLRAAKQDEKFRDGEFRKAITLFGWLTDVIVEALDIGYTVECLDTLEAVGASDKLRVQALDNSAVGVISAGAEGFIALVGADHLEGIAAGLEGKGWSSESEIIEDSEFGHLKGLAAGLDWKGGSSESEISEDSEIEAPASVAAPAMVPVAAGPVRKKKKWYKPWTWFR